MAKLFVPEWVFVFFALIGGGALIALMPPGGGNERFNYQRIATIASGYILIQPAVVPAGIAEFVHATRARFPNGAAPPYSYSSKDWAAVASIPLQSNRPTVLEPNPIAVLHPLSYLPQAPAMALGQAIGLSPLTLLYVGRTAGLLGGIVLTFFAIRAIPFHKNALAAIALLPTVLYSRSVLDADQFTNGLAFFFLASVMRETVRANAMSAGRIAVLATTAFVLAQSKSAYLLIPFFALTIPTVRFISRRRRVIAMALIIVPGIIGSLLWMISLKEGYFAGVRYVTWSGIVDPDAQFRAVLADPVGYAEIFLRTLFSASLIPVTILGMIAPAIMPLWLFPVFAVALAALFITESDATYEDSSFAKACAVVIVVVTSATILTLLYLQWTKLGGQVIEGFQGRYLYPLAPLLLMFIPTGDKGRLVLNSVGWLSFIGAASVIAMSWAVWSAYLA